MRLTFLPIAVTALLIGRLAAPIPSSAQATPETGTGSLLALPPGGSTVPPLPVPLPGEAASPAQALPPLPSDRANAPPMADPGTVSAVPLPPPGSQPAPAAALLTGSPPVASAPVGQPISLSPPPGSSERPTRSEAPRPERGATPEIAPNLPVPPLSPEASPADFLRAARGALAAGRAAEARSALEMAETRLLDRAVDAGKERDPIGDLAVKQINEAINALTAGDRMSCLRYIEFASRTIGSPLD